MLSNDYRLSGLFICEFPLGTFFFIGYGCSMVYGITIYQSIQAQLVGTCNSMRLSDWCTVLISNYGKRCRTPGLKVGGL